jgi:hypothetical protein
MVISKGIELECFVQNNTTNTLSELEIGYELASCDTDVATFYNIDMVAPYVDPYDSSQNYSELSSGGLTFICKLDYQSIKNKIENATKI